MKIQLWNLPRNGRPPGGFTLVEMLSASGLTSLVVLTLLGTNLFGLRIFNLTVPKLNAGQAGKAILNPLREEARGANTLVVGNGGPHGFTNLPAGSPRTGNALQIYSTTDTNTFVRYYVDSATRTLQRITSGGEGKVLAQNMANPLAFTAQTFSGTAMTNDVNVRLIDLSLQFREWALPGSSGVNGAIYNYYQLHTRIARRRL